MMDRTLHSIFPLVRKSSLLEPIIKNGPSLISISKITTVTQDTVSNQRIPGPKQWPILGCLPAVITNKAFDKERIYLLWHDLAKKYGPVFQLRFPGSPTLNFLSNVEDIEKLYKVTAENPIRPLGDSLRVANKRCPSKAYKEGEYGIIAENGDNWWRVRRQVQAPLMKPRMVSLYLPGMDQISKDFVDRIGNQLDEKKEVSDDFMKEILRWAVDNVGLISFNKRFENREEGEQMMESAITAITNWGKLEYGLHLWRYIQTPKMVETIKARDYMRRQIEKSVSEVEDTLKKGDKSEEELSLMEQLLMTPGLTKRDVVLFMLDINMGGVDTTAYTMSFVMYLLATNPEKQEILQKELDEVLGDGTEELTPKHLAKLTYTKAVLRESLRIYPVAGGFLRELINDEVFSGHKLPKGSWMFGLEYPNCHSEELFYAPEEFLPERWLRHRPYGQIHNYACFSFSRGKRSCVGRRVSEQESYALIARLFHKYTLEWKYEKLNPTMDILLHPDLPLKFTFKTRENRSL